MGRQGRITHEHVALDMEPTFGNWHDGSTWTTGFRAFTVLHSVLQPCIIACDATEEKSISRHVALRCLPIKTQGNLPFDPPANRILPLTSLRTLAFLACGIFSPQTRTPLSRRYRLARVPVFLFLATPSAARASAVSRFYSRLC